MADWPVWLVWCLAVAGLGLLVAGLGRILAVAVGRPASPRALVSLVLVLENAEDVVEDALRRAVLRYGWWSGATPAYELVVVDVGSTDDTPAIVERFARRHPGFIRLVRVAPGTTTARAVAYAALACRGETMVTLDLASLVGKRRRALRQETGTT